MDEPVAIGVDLGATHIKSGVSSATGELSHAGRVDTPAASRPEPIAEALIDAIKPCIHAAKNDGLEPRAVGVVMPGLLEADGRTVRFAANLPALAGFALPAYLSERLDLPVVFDADSNGAAWGEYRFGAGRAVERLVVMTVGTGIGVGVVIDGALVRTSNGTAGSLGHLIVDPAGPRCACGARGCLERRAGWRGIEDTIHEESAKEPQSQLAVALRSGDTIDGERIRAALDVGDPIAVTVVERCGYWLGVGMACLAVLFSPERIVLGGGLSGLGQPLVDAARNAMRQVGGAAFVDSVDVGLAELGNHAGVIGAAALALEARR